MTISPSPLPASPRILIVRLSAIGDCVHGLPVACALREHLPTAQVGWVVEGRSADLLRGHTAIDRVINIPRGWYKSLGKIKEVRRQVRDFAPNVTLDLQGLTKSAAIARMSGAKKRIGFSGAEGREISTWLNTDCRAASATHVVDKNLQLLRSLGITVADPTSPSAHHGGAVQRVDSGPSHAGASVTAMFQLTPDDAAGRMIEQFIFESSLQRGYVVLNPGAGWASKRWPIERFAQLARTLGQQHSIRSVIAWGPGEERLWADQIVAGSGGQACVAPPTSLNELVELARRARLFCSGDTGPMHLAAAVGTPCVALFGASDGERNGPYGPGHVILQNVKLTGSSRKRRTADNRAMCAIEVAEVAAACGAVLQSQTKDAATGNSLNAASSFTPGRVLAA